MTEANQNTEEITTEEPPVSAPPKQEVVEDIPNVEETPAIIEIVTDEQVAPIEEVGNQTEQVEIPEVEVVEPIIEQVEIPKVVEVTENEQNDAGLPRSSAVAPELTKTTEEIGQPQEIPTQPQIKTVEKIVYQTPPNFIQNLLNKARVKIQERKQKKLDKIMSLFELNSEISNSNIQKLLRTTKRSATRYLNILEKEQKITQIGKTGRSVKYTKKQ